METSEKAGEQRKKQESLVSPQLPRVFRTTLFSRSDFLQLPDNRGHHTAATLKILVISSGNLATIYFAVCHRNHIFILRTWVKVQEVNGPAFTSVERFFIRDTTASQRKSKNSQIVSKLQPRNKPMLPPNSPERHH